MNLHGGVPKSETDSFLKREIGRRVLLADQKPVEEILRGYVVRENPLLGGMYGELILNRVVERSYPHPESPEHALLPIVETEHIGIIKPPDDSYPIVYGLWQAQRAVFLTYSEDPPEEA